MKPRYDAAQLSRILDQALVYQCACPAQVCKTLFELRDLYDYQRKCASASDTDQAVHATIAEATERTHALMETCLTQVLELEGWDLATLKMPDNLRKKAAKPL